MPAFHEALIGGVRITYTIEREGTLLLARSDLAPSDPAAGGARLLERVAEAVGSGRVRTLLADAPDAPWILEDGEVWELQRWGAFVGEGLHLPGPPVPDRPGALVPARSARTGGKSVQDGFAAEKAARPERRHRRRLVVRRRPADAAPVAVGREPGPPVGALAAVGARSRRRRRRRYGARRAATKLFCAAPAFAAALWLCTGAGAPAPAPAPAPAAASAEAPRREAARSWEELAADAECLRRCWGRAAHVDAWRDALGIAEASTPAAQQRDRRRRISGLLGGRARGRRARAADAGGGAAGDGDARAGGAVGGGRAVAALVRARLGAYAAAVGWAWLRLPAVGLGVRPVITRFATFGHLIHTRTLAATPWLQRWPWRLHLRVHAEDFGFGNRRRASRTPSSSRRAPSTSACRAASPTVALALGIARPRRAPPTPSTAAACSASTCSSATA